MQDFFDTFYECIIAGNSYLTILKGLGVTSLITVGGIFFGTIIALGLCAMSRSRFKILRLLDTIYSVVLRGTPIPMLLMLLFYVVFAKTDIDAMIIAVVGFSLNSAAYIDEIMKTSISSVNEGQIKAARTLGMTSFQSFVYVVFPQATRFAKPIFQSTIISVIQWTSVVGTITIADLTRVINNIGARTAKPFFVIFMGIVFYLLLGFIVNMLFKIRFKKAGDAQ